MTPNLEYDTDSNDVVTVRTGAFLVASDMDGNVHMGFDAFREGKVLTLPGGNIEPSDRNLFAAAMRETKQEFGRHMRYHLIDAKPFVFLCHSNDDSCVTDPYPGQHVKLRVAWFVMDIDQHLPVEQKRPEVLSPMAYRITADMLETLSMRESSRIALREAFLRGHLPQPKYMPGLKPDMESLRQQMLDLKVPERIADYHGLRRVNRRATPFDDYLRRLEKAEDFKKQKELQELRAARTSELSWQNLTQIMPELREMFIPNSASNEAYVAASEALLDQLAEEFSKRAA